VLRCLSTVLGYAIQAVDGELGNVRDFFFDDQTWMVRYLVVQTGTWLNHRRVLLSTGMLGKPDWLARRFPVSLTQEQVRGSPDIDTDKPVSRQHEIAMNAHYGLPYYWSIEPLPISLPATPVEAQEVEGDPHLRSLREVSTYRVHCGEENAGSVDDFIADDGSWSIRWLVVALGGGWWLRKRVLVGTPWIRTVSWADGEVHVKLSREQLEKSPEFDPATAVNREYEVRLYDYYGRPIDSEEPVWPPPAG
jgi:hypothetical protein